MNSNVCGWVHVVSSWTPGHYNGVEGTRLILKATLYTQSPKWYIQACR